MARRLRFAILLSALLAGPAAAQSPVLSLTGNVKHPQHWTIGDLEKMPPQHVAVSYQTGHGSVTAGFTGVQLWTLIEKAGGLTDSGKDPALRHAIRITAKDNYTVVTSTGEIAPEFGNKGALVAYARDGKPLGDFRLVMPGDKRGGRNVRDMTTISVE